MTGPASRTVDGLFEEQRVNADFNNDWGLAWYLAFQFCRRYYVSHGIVPQTIDKATLGYYGIGLTRSDCLVHASSAGEPLGRLTMFGDVENWRSGSPGDHGLNTIDLCRLGVVTDELVKRAIVHMDIPSIPSPTHLGCRHQRRGASYVLCFEIATILALSHGKGGISIWNDHYQTQRAIREFDPDPGEKEHPGLFVFASEDAKVVLRGDGRMLAPVSRDIWRDFVDGASAWDLAREVHAQLYGSEALTACYEAFRRVAANYGRSGLREAEYAGLIQAEVFGMVKERTLQLVGLSLPELKKHLSPKGDALRTKHLPKAKDIYPDFVVVSDSWASLESGHATRMEQLTESLKVEALFEYKTFCSFSTLPYKKLAEDAAKLEILGDYLKHKQGLVPHLELVFFNFPHKKIGYMPMKKLLSWFDKIHPIAPSVVLKVIDDNGEVTHLMDPRRKG